MTKMKKVFIILLTLSISSYAILDGKVLWSDNYDFNKSKFVKSKLDLETQPFSHFQNYTMEDSNVIKYKCDCYINAKSIIYYPSYATRKNYREYLNIVSDFCELSARENKKNIREKGAISINDTSDIFNSLYTIIENNECYYRTYLLMNKDSLKLSIAQKMNATNEFSHENCPILILNFLK